MKITNKPGERLVLCLKLKITFIYVFYFEQCNVAFLNPYTFVLSRQHYINPGKATVKMLGSPLGRIVSEF